MFTTKAFPKGKIQYDIAVFSEDFTHRPGATVCVAAKYGDWRGEAWIDGVQDVECFALSEAYSILKGQAIAVLRAKMAGRYGDT